MNCTLTLLFLLLTPNFLDLTDLLLNLAGYLFNGAFSFQLWIVAYFSGDFFDITLHFMKHGFCFVLCARFHTILLFLIYLLDRYLFCIAMESYNEARLCDNSMRF